MSVPLERVTSSGSILPAPWLRQWNEALGAYFYINPTTEPPTRQWAFPAPLGPDPNPYGTPPAGPPGAAATAATVVYLPPSPNPAAEARRGSSTEEATPLNTPDALHRAEERGARLAHGLDALHARRVEAHERVEERVHNVVSAIDDILHREHKATHAPTPSQYTQGQYRPVTPGYGYSEGGGSTGFTYQNCYDGRSARAQ
ncbi:uncharacterized protein LOC62_04G006117 [Vanrija pseudolonga]|uniref:WW domain-containing protein n=1 Tax=Vanrija pseudolonga TaxID=143232 RepID=A0AAF1BLU3_9TREE|nr:hypothetical protein LOC62_04G006117 [Vanrija pseudolonga]